MIRSFRHRGLKALYEGRTEKLIGPQHRQRVHDILTSLDLARTPHDMALPGYRLHALSGRLKGSWAVTVTRNWRVIFRFEAGEAVDVDYVDYH